MHEIIPDDSCIPALDVLDRKEVLSLLTQRMAELPDIAKEGVGDVLLREYAPLRNCGLLQINRVSDLPNPHSNVRLAPRLPRQATCPETFRAVHPDGLEPPTYSSVVLN